MVHEAADLLFHYLVLLEKVNISLEEVVDELLSREGVSGFEEKRERKRKLVIYSGDRSMRTERFFGNEMTVGL